MKYFKLPEKWCVKTEPETRSIVNDFIISQGYPFKWNMDLYAHFPFFGGTWTGELGSGYSEIKEGYTEITFEQFTKYVLNNETMKLKQDMSYLILFLKNLNLI